MLSEQQDKDSPLTSILHRATIVDTLREENDVVPDFQRVTITGEETSGVRLVHRRRVLYIVNNVELTTRGPLRYLTFFNLQRPATAATATATA